MSFRGGGGGRGRGGFSSRGGRGGAPSYGPPAEVLEMGAFVHATEGDIVCESINPKVPYFNAPIYLENKSTIGKVDEILGPINQVYFTVKPQEGIVATSFRPGDKFYIGGDKLLPLERFLPKPKPPPGTAKPKRGGAGRGGVGGFQRGGRAGPGGRGGPRGRGGPSRGGFSRGGSRGGSGPRGGGFTSGGRGGARGGGFTRGGFGRGRG